MSKKGVMAGALIGGVVGSYVPTLFGDSLLGGWSILGSVVGGLVGIWLAVWISKRYGE
jgi:outer membrane lipoprotein SlyB